MKFARTFRVALLVLVSLQIHSKLGPFANRVRAAGGEVLWEEQLQIGSSNRPSQVLVNAGQLVVAGFTQEPTENVDGILAAYDINTGGLLWSDTIDTTATEEEPPGLWDFVAGLVASSQHVFVTWNSVQPEDGVGPADRAFHRKYEAFNGSLVWERTVASPRSDQWRDASSMAASQGRFFVSGTVGLWDERFEPARLGPTQAFTRAYNSAGGALLWQAWGPQSSSAGISVASGNRLFLILGIGNSQVLRAYDIVTGVKVYEQSLSGKSVAVMKVNGNQLVLGGTANDGKGGTDLFVTAYGASGGALMWEDHPHKTGNDGTNDIAFGGGKVFMCGSQTNAAGNTDFLVRAYDALEGHLLWERVVDKGGFDVASAVAVHTSTGKVFAAGWGHTTVGCCGDDEETTRRHLVQAYNMNSGALAWEDFAASNPLGGDFTTQAVVAGESLLTVGVTNDSPTFGATLFVNPSDILIRAYDAK